MSAVDVPGGLPARIETPAAGDVRLSRLSFNQRTAANWSLAEAIAGATRAGIESIGVWREELAEVGLALGKKMIDDAGLRVSSLCRGGFFTDPATLVVALESNRRAIDEAAGLDARTLILVAGGLAPGDRDVIGARHRATAAIATLVPYARERGVNLSIEPMHPIFAADRGVISTLGQALDVAEQFDAADVGVVVDTFHVWWDPELGRQLARAGERISSYQVCDWITPLPADTLLSRGMMGDGHIDFADITTRVKEAGYTGDIEVEIFNAEVWAADGDAVVDTLARRYVELVSPYL